MKLVNVISSWVGLLRANDTHALLGGANELMGWWGAPGGQEGDVCGSLPKLWTREGSLVLWALETGVSDRSFSLSRNICSSLSIPLRLPSTPNFSSLDNRHSLNAFKLHPRSKPPECHERLRKTLQESLIFMNLRRGRGRWQISTRIF